MSWSIPDLENKFLAGNVDAIALDPNTMIESIQTVHPSSL
jgi:hypothetical protein